jgi:hypothetical protein
MSLNLYNDLPSLFKSIYISEYLKTNLLPARKAFLEAVTVIFRALSGSLRSAYHLFPVDCGGGKSMFIIDILRLWKQLKFQPDGGVIVALHTLEGVEAFATNCGLDKSDYAVFTGKEMLNAYGRGRDGANDAPVLFTTQQMAIARMDREGSFGGIAEFHYKGRPRRCRLWDESLEPAPAIVIPLDVLSALPGKLRRSHSAYVAILDDILAHVHGARDRDAMSIPQVLDHAGDAIVATFDELALLKEEQEAVRKLARLAGRTVGIERGPLGQLAFVGAGKPLPTDFMPVIVFDASARLRDTYRLQEQFQGNVVRMAGVEHSYADTSIHLCKVPIGTDKLADPVHRGEILTAAADLINSDPDADWLVIHHMAKTGRYDIEAELKGLLNDKRQARFIHWGSHYGSNAYRMIQKVIVIGMWRKPDWVYAALHMASSGQGYEAVTKEACKALRQQEHCHDLMQAIGRSNIRNVLDGVAGRVDAYVFASPEDGLEDRIRATFPGCKMVPWEPVQSTARGHLAAAIAYLSAMPPGVVSKQIVRKDLSISTSQGFSHVTKDKRFKRFLANAGIVMEKYKFVRMNPAL